MPMYFWVRSQLGESERKLLREAGGEFRVSFDLIHSLNLVLWGFQSEGDRAGYTHP